MPISSNRRQRVIEFATPKVADLVVVERVDCSKNVSSAAVADDTAYGTPHPDTAKFPSFKLALIKNGDDEQGQFQDWYYVKDRDKQDEYNWEYQAAGASTPHYDTVVRTYVTPRSALTNDEFVSLGAFQPDDPEIGPTSKMPVTLSDPFEEDDDYILFEKKQTRSGDEFLDTLYVVEQHVYVKRVPMWRVDVDPEFPEYPALISKETLWHKDEEPVATRKFEDGPDGETGAEDTVELFADEDAKIDVHKDFLLPGQEVGEAETNFWGVDQHGILREGKQLTDNWYAIIEKQVVGATGLLSSIETHQSYSWPAVLQHINIYGWTRKEGGTDTVGVPIFEHQAWSGPTRMLIKRYWQKEPWVFHVPVAVGGEEPCTPVVDCYLQPAGRMFPIPVTIATPLFSLKISSCLHEQFTFRATTGTNHPIYKYAGSITNYAATVPTEWINHVVSDTQTPFRGGYLREYTKAYIPT